MRNVSPKTTNRGPISRRRQKGHAPMTSAGGRTMSEIRYVGALVQKYFGQNCGVPR